MNSNVLLTIFVIIFCIHFTNGEDSITSYMDYEDIPNYLTKDEVLKIKDVPFVTFYCKNNLCVKTRYDYGDYFVKLPDENGRIKKYNAKTCPRNEFESETCEDKVIYHREFVSINYTMNSDFLSNKCLNSFYVFNDENPIIHCDSIYNGSRTSYIYCGKAYGDSLIFILFILNINIK